ncbi:hypothetical protein IE81DRAFT_150752 [Ceraceosorus guamensis]|uniref:Uncharacterized protein n=1 Tax=Ceraceosorus guamensis TaxID=1522189 RepID=A0A316VXF6_9BASI|nr:hypothetical protein IE81DRAFT_150752 [Ceraceosorus guamensis]PWN41994.1 hypothetical protein IE81DRAFT_150752 [Ceraceosorus guamensis]
MSCQLPPEIVAFIFKLALHGPDATACALTLAPVCRACLPDAREALYHTPNLTRHNIARFLETMTGSVIGEPAPHKLVRRLVFCTTTMQASERRLARRRSELGRYAGSASLRSAAVSTGANAVANIHDSHNHPSLRQVLATLICCKHTLEELMLDLTCSAVACSWTHSLNDDLSEFEHELASLSKLRELSIRSPKGCESRSENVLAIIADPHYPVDCSL